MSITYTSGNSVLNKLFGNSTLSQPSTLYFGLSSTIPNIDGTGSTEPSVGAYSRVALTNSDKTNWSVSTLGTLTNLTSITFPESTASWGTLLAVVVFDASSGGNLWFFEALSPSITVAINTTVFFSASGITISMTNS